MNISEIWGALYQSESDPDKMRLFREHQASIKLLPEIKSAIAQAVVCFTGDYGHNTNVLIALLRDTAKHESYGGRVLAQVNGPARGAWMVEPETALSIVRTSGLIGPNALKLMRIDPKDFELFSTVHWGDFLTGHKRCAVMACAKYLQAAKAKGLLAHLQ